MAVGLASALRILAVKFAIKGYAAADFYSVRARTFSLKFSCEDTQRSKSASPPIANGYTAQTFTRLALYIHEHILFSNPLIVDTNTMLLIQHRQYHELIIHP